MEEPNSLLPLFIFLFFNKCYKSSLHNYFFFMQTRLDPARYKPIDSSLIDSPPG